VRIRTLGAVTELEHGIEADVAEEPTPELIATHYLTSIDDVVEHLRAASQLGLGVRVRTYLEEEDAEVLAERWELELLTSSPVHQETAPPEDAAE
jgi:hypothetical protein